MCEDVRPPATCPHGKSPPDSLNKVFGKRRSWCGISEEPLLGIEPSSTQSCQYAANHISDWAVTGHINYRMYYQIVFNVQCIFIIILVLCIISVISCLYFEICKCFKIRLQVHSFYGSAVLLAFHSRSPPGHSFLLSLKLLHVTFYSETFSCFCYETIFIWCRHGRPFLLLVREAKNYELRCKWVF